MSTCELHANCMGARSTSRPLSTLRHLLAIGCPKHGLVHEDTIHLTDLRVHHPSAPVPGARFGPTREACVTWTE